MRLPSSGNDISSSFHSVYIRGRDRVDWSEVYRDRDREFKLCDGYVVEFYENTFCGNFPV